MRLKPVYSTDLVDGPAFLMFGMASSEIRLMAIFISGYCIPALIALRYLWKQMWDADAVR